MQRICVFTGSKLGNREEYQQVAYRLGQELVERGLGLVYGGASVGLMGVVADSVLAGGGEVIGVIPRNLFKNEVGHAHLSKLYEVESMHERKAKMADLADGFIALPGGFGTFDELFEIITWAQIGIHTKPVGLLDVAGYFAPLQALVAHAVQEGFLSAFHAGLLLHNDNPVRLLDAFATYQTIAYQSKWTDAPPAR
jgi:uncharacterized protein (TIGR00730 family)